MNKEKHVGYFFLPFRLREEGSSSAASGDRRLFREEGSSSAASGDRRLFLSFFFRSTAKKYKTSCVSKRERQDKGNDVGNSFTFSLSIWLLLLRLLRLFCILFPHFLVYGEFFVSLLPPFPHTCLPSWKIKGLIFIYCLTKLRKK